MPIDPLLSLLICVLIVISSTRLLLETLHVVMEGVPAGVNLDELRNSVVNAHPDVVGIHHLHVWAISSSKRAMSAHIEVCSTNDWDSVLATLAAMVHDDFNIDHPTFQPEQQRCVDEGK